MPQSWAGRAAHCLLQSGQSVLWLAEQSGVPVGGLKIRLPMERWVVDRNVQHTAGIEKLF